MKKIIIKVLLIILGLLFGLLISEIIVRQFKPQLTFSTLPTDSPKCYKEDPLLSFRHLPNSICHLVSRGGSDEFVMDAKINNLGFRGNYNIDPKKPQGKRILFLGDSFTFGQGVADNQTYPEIVRQILASNGEKVEVINAAMEGSELSMYYLILKEQIAKLKPDLVVVGLFLGNDLSDQGYFEWSKIDQNGLPEKIKYNFEYIESDHSRRSATTPKRFRIPILRNSHLFMLIIQTIFGSPDLAPFTAIVNGMPCYFDPKCETIKPEIEKASKLLSAMDKIVKAQNSKMLAVLIPWEMQLPYSVLEKSGIKIFVTDTRRHYLSNTFIEALTKEDITVFDLLPVFDNYQGKKQIIFPVDKHFTAEGNKVVAEVLAPIIKKMLEQNE